MINYLLFITGFLIGIFIVLIIVSDKQILTIFNNTETKEGFGEAKKFEDTEIVKVPFVPPPTLKEVIIAPTNDDPVPYVATNTEIIDNYNFNKLLRKREMRILITSYNNENIDIDINKLEWITDNKNYNNNIRLKLSDNEIVKEFNNMNPFVNGYNIHNVSIQGPANAEVYEKEKEISQFSILFMFMHKQFHHTKNNLFIIYGVDNKNIVINIKDNEFNNNNYYNVNNDINDNSDMNGAFDKNDINKSINLLNNYHYYENYDILSNKAKEQKSYKLSYFEKLYTIEIIIDDSVYNINDINMETLKRDITFFGLMMNKEDVVFHLNNTKYEFKRNNDKSIKVGKEPFVINKNKSCEIVLYSFAYFNEAISDADLKIFKLYNKYKLYGIHNRDKVGKADVKPNDTTIRNVEIKIPLTLSMKDIRDTEVNTIIATKEIADIKKI
jgi:hypothetical protein